MRGTALTLSELGDRYGTDKVVAGYTRFYSGLFDDRRTEVLKVMEIGIGSPETMQHVPGYVAGASLFMWRDYFENAQIYGLDNNEKSLIEEDRIHSLLCSQDDLGDLSKVAAWSGDGFDLILDDGDHRAKSQWAAFHVLFPLVKLGGLYIIEDAEAVDGNMRYLCALIPNAYEAVTLEAGGKLVMIKSWRESQHRQ